MIYSAEQNTDIETEECEPLADESSTLLVNEKNTWNSSCGTFRKYLAQVFSAPLLQADQEIALFERFQKDGDAEALSLLVKAYLRLVHVLARERLGYGIALDDLVQEGNIGLLKAINRFDLSMKCRLGTFAKPWITAEINEYAMRNMRIVRMATTKAQRKLFFNLRQVKKNLRKTSNPGLVGLTTGEAEGIAKMLCVEVTDVIEMEQRLSGIDCGFETPLPGHGLDYVTAEHLTAKDDSLETLMVIQEHESLAHDGVAQALETLDARSRRIIEGRWIEVSDEGEGMTLNELAIEFKVSTERIRQIEKRAMQTMKAALEKFA